MTKLPEAVKEQFGNQQGKIMKIITLAAYTRSLGHACVLLDGDELRTAVDVAACFSRDERVRLGIQDARLCLLLAAQGIGVIIAIIALYSEKRFPNVYENSFL